MYCVAYKFTLLSDSLPNRREFMDCWGGITQFFKDECGALGSRLHGGTGGVFYAYAQWPSKAKFEAIGEIEPSDTFIQYRIRWAEICGPSEVLFEGRVVEDMIDTHDTHDTD